MGPVPDPHTVMVRINFLRRTPPHRGSTHPDQPSPSRSIPKAGRTKLMGKPSDVLNAPVLNRQDTRGSMCFTQTQRTTPRTSFSSLVRRSSMPARTAGLNGAGAPCALMQCARWQASV